MIRDVYYGEGVEDTIVNILNDFHVNGPINPRLIEELTYIKMFNNEILTTYERRLLYLMGMFYKVSQPKGVIEEVYSIFSEAIYEEIGSRYTPMQSEAYRSILNKKYFSFSAPTSSGKSHLLRDIIRTYENDIVIVVPSRALISEYIASILEIVDKDVLVLQFIENVNISKVDRRIYVVTPERAIDLFEIADELNVELILLDEAQISEEEVRGLKFDSFVRRADRHLPTTRKVFAHPFVNNPEAQLSKHGFYEDSRATTYNQHSVGKVYIAKNDEQFEFFSPYDAKWTELEVKLENDIVVDKLREDGTVLIYISKAKILNGEYMEIFSKYIDVCERITEPEALDLINELKEYIGANEGEKQSNLIHMMERGIVVHHGSIPLKARLIIERFVKLNYAKLCFATSTLNQGINMPFDVVWIDNFWRMEPLVLKNLIGRAGRSTMNEDVFDFGFVIIDRSHRDTFIDRISDVVNITETSKLDDESLVEEEDLLDIVEAMKDDSFNDEFKLTDSQVERLKDDNIENSIQYVLDNLLVDLEPIKGKAYYALSDYKRGKIKSALKDIFITHLRRDQISKEEASILSASIPIMLWQIQGKSFSEIVSLRYSYLTEKDMKREIRKRISSGQITASVGEAEMRAIPPRYSTKAGSLPNVSAVNINLCSEFQSILDVDYDTVVYDTYDYLDKVISLSLVNPLCAAFSMYSQAYDDERGEVLSNYIKYGTNDATEIWLLRYGFSFEEIEWISEYVDSVDAESIVFKDSISELDEKEMMVIERFL